MRIEITGKTFWKISSNLCKALTIFITKEGKPSPDRNKKKNNFWRLITCFCHYDIFARTRNRMTTAIHARVLTTT